MAIYDKEEWDSRLNKWLTSSQKEMPYHIEQELGRGGRGGFTGETHSQYPDPEQIRAIVNHIGMEDVASIGSMSVIAAHPNTPHDILDGIIENDKLPSQYSASSGVLFNPKAHSKHLAAVAKRIDMDAPMYSRLLGHQNITPDVIKDVVEHKANQDSNHNYADSRISTLLDGARRASDIKPENLQTVIDHGIDSYKRNSGASVGGGLYRLYENKQFNEKHLDSILPHLAPHHAYTLLSNIQSVNSYNKTAKTPISNEALSKRVPLIPHSQILNSSAYAAADFAGLGAEAKQHVLEALKSTKGSNDSREKSNAHSILGALANGRHISADEGVELVTKHGLGSGEALQQFPNLDDFKQHHFDALWDHYKDPRNLPRGNVWHPHAGLLRGDREFSPDGQHMARPEYIESSFGPNAPMDLRQEAASHPAAGPILTNKFAEHQKTGELDLSLWPAMTKRSSGIPTKALLDHMKNVIAQPDVANNPKAKTHLLQEGYHSIRANHAPLLRDNADTILSDPQHIKHLGDRLLQAQGVAGSLKDHHWSNLIKHAPNMALEHMPTVHPRFGELLKGSLRSSNKETRYEASRKYFSRWDKISPDSMSNTKVKVKLDTNKLRQLRDHIQENHGGEAHHSVLKQAGVYDDNTMKHLKNMKGRISADGVQRHIDSVPEHEYNVTHTIWSGAQRHNHVPSKVFQLNMTDDHIKKLKSADLWDYWTSMNNERNSGGHPTTPHTIGWARWTGHPKSGVFIDEIQSDHWRKPETETWSDEANDYVTTPDEHKGKLHKGCMDILFGGRHPGEVIHEAFHQYMRNRGHAGTPISIHSVNSKAPISLGRDWDVNADTGNREGVKRAPVHMQETYNKIPKKMGYKPGKYGDDVPRTQTNTNVGPRVRDWDAQTVPNPDWNTPYNRKHLDLTGAPTTHDIIRKMEKIKQLLRKLKGE